MKMSNLPQDLVEEILSRVPLSSLKAVRSTCKKWNALTKDQSFTNKHIRNVATSGEREFLMIMDYKAYYWIGVKLHGTQKENVNLSIKLKGKLNSIDSPHEVLDTSQVFHCNGLVLFVLDTSLVVWNPYCGIPKCIKRPYKYRRRETFALGFDESCGSHKILRLYGNYPNSLEIYDLSTDSWMVPNVTLRDIMFIKHVASVKGNSYWYARDEGSAEYYLFCFDFTRNRFGPRLLLPVNGRGVSLSAVKEEQLALLVKGWNRFDIEIWLTNKIASDAISWCRFLKFELKARLLDHVDFLIDEKKKVAVVFHRVMVKKEVFDRVGAASLKRIIFRYTNIAYIIGENNYIRRVDLYESLNTSYFQLACSYVPSCVQIK